jgi:hypothetical protein
LLLLVVVEVEQHRLAVAVGAAVLVALEQAQGSLLTLVQHTQLRLVQVAHLVH